MLRSTHILRQARNRFIQQSGIVYRPGDIRSAILGTGDAAVDLSVARDLAAAVDGTADASVALSILHDLSASIDGTADVACELSIVAIGDYVARYTMNDATGADETGTYDGTWTGTPSVVTGVTGSAVSLNGTQSLEAPTNLVPAARNFTVTFWADKDSMADSTAFVSQYVGADAGRWFICKASGNIEVRRATTTIIQHSLAAYSGWVHFALTCTAAGDYILYVNASSADTGSNGGNIKEVSTTIAALETGVWNATVKMDDVRFYHRVLTPGEITQVYNYRE